MKRDSFYQHYFSLALHHHTHLNHGHWKIWDKAISDINGLHCNARLIDDDIIFFQPQREINNSALKNYFMQLKPWRKGPYRVGDVVIDSEWQCQYKWQRIASLINWQDKNILDIGSGNGYFSIRASLAGANTVVALDPTELFLAQFKGLMATCEGDNPIRCLFIPAKLEDLVIESNNLLFDCALSMGVLYHRRDPIAHLDDIKRCVRSGGEVIIETLIQEEQDVIVPSDNRYCGMPNVYALPNIPTLIGWLEQAGFEAITVEDKTYTTAEEQRATAWSGVHSLEDRLDADNPKMTVEGLPAPLRAVIKATVA